MGRVAKGVLESPFGLMSVGVCFHFAKGGDFQGVVGFLDSEVVEEVAVKVAGGFDLTGRGDG